MSSSKAYPGSCHCGDVQYQLKLKFPPTMSKNAESIRIYKCNCTVCQKMGFFHCRPINPAKDFILTSPENVEELGEYRTQTKKLGFYFCKKCGVRIVALGGEWEEQASFDVAQWAGTKQEGDKEKLQKVWKTRGTTIKSGADATTPYHYLSVNAVTLEPGDEIDLKKWHEDGWVFYVENLARKDGTQLRVREPFEGGIY